LQAESGIVATDQLQDESLQDGESAFVMIGIFIQDIIKQGCGEETLKFNMFYFYLLN